MSSKFSFLSRSSFMQNMASRLIAMINPIVIHNIGKYMSISNLFFYTAVEKIEGDYLEFGVFTGSSFTHAIRCYKKTKVYEDSDTYPTKFFGFDSFDGFGELDQKDEHPFLKGSNFPTNYDKVQKRVSAVSSHVESKLIKGFFSESLNKSPESYGISKARIIFIDCDTYMAAKDVFSFCTSIIQQGTIIVLDDQMLYRGDEEKGVTAALHEFLAKNTNIRLREYSRYGNGAGIYIVSKCNS